MMQTRKLPCSESGGGADDGRRRLTGKHNMALNGYESAMSAGDTGLPLSLEEPSDTGNQAVKCRTPLPAPEESLEPIIIIHKFALETAGLRARDPQEKHGNEKPSASTAERAPAAAT